MIRPAYWTDADLHTRLTAEQREFYVGLWMLADDAGFVAWDLHRVGAELYPYRSPAWREKRLGAWLELLGVEHARLLDCGAHVQIPNLPKYQNPPRPSNQTERQHMSSCGRHVAPHGPSGEQMAPAQGFSKGFSREGREVEGRAAAREIGTNEESAFQSRVPRALALGGKAS